jgi:F0F1-type ATP synthase membrane subunit b/b'
MNNEIAQMDLDMPQLRQMVLENTERINRNELIINKMRMESAEQTRKVSEQDEWLENIRKENDRSMRLSRERMDRLEKFAETSRLEYEQRVREINEERKASDKRIEEYRRESDKRIEESRRESDRRIEESRRESDRRIEESRKETEREVEEMLAKTHREVKEMFAETNATIRRVSVEFLGVTGHIVEGLVSSSTEKIFKDAGFDLHDSGKNLRRELASEDKQMEVDALLGNEKLVVPVEVKANFTKKKVKRFLHKMEMFRKFFPEYADKEVIAAIAAINYEAGVADFAHEEGLLVIRVSSDDIFSLDPVDEKKLRKF